MHPLLAARVAGQSGLVTRAQALAGGISTKAIECHLASGRWVRIHPGVYLTRPGRDDWEMRAVAALLHAGRGAALCLRSAAHAWGLLKAEPALIEVVVPAARRVRNARGVVIRRSRFVPERTDEHAWPHRIVPEHTVLDLTEGLGLDRTVSLAAKAIDRGLTTPGRLASALRNRPRQRHRSLLLDVFADVAAGAESPAEVRYLRDVERAHALPTGRRQVLTTAGLRRDVEYEEWGVVVEVDGRLGHDGWIGVQRDGRRDRAATVQGRTTLRCYWPDLVPTGCDLAVDVAHVLRGRGWTGAPRPCRPGCPVRSIRW